MNAKQTKTTEEDEEDKGGDTILPVTETPNRFRVDEEDSKKLEVFPVCFYCQEEIGRGSKIYWVGLDRPYISLPFHLACHMLIRRDYLDEREYYQEESNSNRLMQLVHDGKESSSKQKSKILSKKR